MELLGCTADELLQHIIKQFLPGMTLENYGNKEGHWSIDHIIPLDTIKDINDIEQIKKVCHYITKADGGQHAVREICEEILTAKGFGIDL